MSKGIVEAIAEAEPESVENQSASEFVLSRSEKLQGEPEASQESSEVKEEVEETESVAETEPEAEDNVLSQLNLDELSEEQLSALREKLIPGAESRIGELTKKRKTAEEELIRVREQQKELKIEKPKVSDNPFKDLSTIEDLQSKADEVTRIIDWAEDLLFESDYTSATDEITQLEGQPMTKADVRNALKNAKQARDTYIPDQLNSLKDAQDAESVKLVMGKKAVEELEWLQDKSANEQKSAFVEFMSDPRLKKLSEVDPSLSSILPYFIAHATNSIYGRKEIPNSPTNTQTKPKANIALEPSSNSVPSSATSEKTEKRSTKAIQELNSRFKQSGQKSDFITLRTLQLKNR